MAVRSTALIARKSIRARLGRTIAITVAIMAGVSFVVGSFVLADSLRAVFDDLFSELSEDVDLEVRSAQEFDDTDGNAREPIDVTIADDIIGIEGVDVVEPTLTRYAQLSTTTAKRSPRREARRSVSRGRATPASRG